MVLLSGVLQNWIKKPWIKQKLKVIGRAGTGYDNIDLAEASKKGIIVFNTPNGNTISAAEHTMALLLALSRNVPQANQALYKGIWDRKNIMGWS